MSNIFQVIPRLQVTGIQKNVPAECVEDVTEDTCNSTKIFQIILHLTVSMLEMVKCFSRGQQEERMLTDLSYWESILYEAGLHARVSGVF